MTQELQQMQLSQSLKEKVDDIGWQSAQASKQHTIGHSLLISKAYILSVEYFPSKSQPKHSQCSPQRQRVVAQVPRAIPILH